ncbi:XrtN system VIT domain-containing protein [Chitinophaga nivalis]|uniref:XrtN system VIT domain-containing protein n=1 Tax=Chitinophaga nivalis TaxID=2991709 RepID=A0ABT3IHD7_9BACT|nr:XrtN system VIT domain-containing protein [Chitinophaga nivalis]MCW3466936.1 XrtN system VIT domain-containing protein [Chitinophaga nivalis]MCW3483373.1 XrtN system VIT domain-containing protein [Chitinophaga nivalis]
MDNRLAKAFPMPYQVGLIALLPALAGLLLPLVIAADITAPFFLINHVVSLLYVFLLLLGKYLKAWPGRRKVMSVFIVIIFINAYSLNREMDVFRESVGWYIVMATLLCMNILLWPFFEHMPKAVRYLQCILMGLTFLIPVYLICYLMRMYLISLLGLLALGISVYTFSPVFIFLYNLSVIKEMIWPHRIYRWLYLGALAVATCFVIAYCVCYVVDKNETDRIYREADMQKDPEMVSWLTVAQQLPAGSMSEKILKTDVVYASPENGESRSDFMNLPSRIYEDGSRHDPLFMTAAFFSGTTAIPESDRLKILDVIYDKRHYTEKRLWSGEDLVTTHVTARADVWPKLHIAYTEYTITVANEPKQRWSGQQEAIYTFHLPEGAVVTSLSLWMKDREEKGILTTKEKATQAYDTIVGVQYRDPSVVHWQEGNRVVVRVFPVEQQEKRTFKLGVTTPLRLENQRLHYTPVWLEGPSGKQAGQDVSLRFDTWPSGMQLPAGFHSGQEKTVTYHGTYNADWTLSFAEEGLTNGSFHFNGKDYTLLPYQPAYTTFVPEQYYLDINNGWKQEDYNNICRLLQQQQVWVAHPEKGMILITRDNQGTLFEELRRYRFSLFPFYKIPDPEKALVITASNGISPQLDELEETRFRWHVYDFLKEHRVRVYDIGEVASPYLTTLRDTRVLLYEKGTPADLLSQLQKHSFLQPQENAQQLVLHHAGIRIVQSAGGVPVTAPDHLARLFAYNDIMRQLGMRAIAEQNRYDSALIQVAKQAYVVSPVSSLIVLETKADYERFDISNDVNSLKNAALQGHGSVPEPHEWGLFSIAMLVLIYVRFEKLFRRKKTITC